MNKQTVFTLIIGIILISCKADSHIISSHEDGPYIFTKGDTSLIVTQENKGKFDSVYLDNEKLSNIAFKCVFDSINYPTLSFRLNPQTDSPDTGIYPMPDKLLAISDIEGNYEKYYDLLVSNNVIDSAYNWTFGNGHLVILGDLVDRGNYVTQCLWLTYHLEGEAQKHGGKVHYLLGNHEQLVLSGFDNYCAPKYHQVLKDLNTDISHLFSAKTELGKWIRSKNSIIKIGDYLFVHAGIDHSLLKYNLSIEKINSEVKRDIDTNEFQTDESFDLLTGRGILWYRGMIEDDDNGDYKKISEQELDDILKHFNSKSIVIGHTPVDNISRDFNGKIIRIDVDHYENSSALYIEKGLEYTTDNKGNMIILDKENQMKKIFIY